jgi:predicted ATPase
MYSVGTSLAGTGLIEAVEFENFKVLRSARLPLSQFTLLVGPNGSGKSTALAGLQTVAYHIGRGWGIDIPRSLSVSAQPQGTITIKLHLGGEFDRGLGIFAASLQSGVNFHYDRGPAQPEVVKRNLNSLRHFALDPQQLATPVSLQPSIELQSNGGGLAGVLDRLRDQHPERFEQLNQELTQWLPEYDRVLFETPSAGQRAFLLRIGKSKQSIPSSDLSEGTLLALALLTLAYLPTPPTILTIEEPDRGIHPRLLRDVQDALYRLAYPKNYGDARDPVQVIATTHSPYFLDLFRGHPEQVVIAQKNGLEATFERLSERPDIEDILSNAPLGEVWYSGILGGVPVGT